MATRHRVWIAAGVLAAAAAAGGALTYRHYARPADPRYAELVDLLARTPAALSPDAGGRAAVPPRFAGLTPRDEVYVVRRDDGSFLVLFPTYYGSGTTLAGLLYTSREFRPGDTYAHQTALGTAHQAIDIGSYRHVKLDHRLDAHWFRVAYAL